VAEGCKDSVQSSSVYRSSYRRTKWVKQWRHPWQRRLGEADRQRPVPRYYGVRVAWVGRRCLLRKWDRAGHKGSRASKAAGRCKRSELCILALSLVFERWDKSL